MAMILGSLLLAPAYAQTSSRDKRIIAYARSLDVSKLDRALPRRRLEPWLRAMVGEKAKLSWEVNDCGEQTGVPGDGSGVNPPVCAQAHALLADGRVVNVFVLVGSHRAGIKGRPSIWTMDIENQGKSKSAATLRELAALLQTSR